MSPNAVNNLIAVAAAVQAVSALAVAFLTVYLVRATNKYVRTTERVLELDWTPDLRIAQLSHPTASYVVLALANLAKPAALVLELKLGVGGRAKMKHPPQDIDSYPLPLLGVRPDIEI